jgi:hypothetical protein
MEWRRLLNLIPVDWILGPVHSKSRLIIFHGLILPFCASTEQKKNVSAKHDKFTINGTDSFICILHIIVCTLLLYSLKFIS